MITLNKLHIYERFKGDIDGWCRATHSKDDQSMTGDDFNEIGQLLQKAYLLKDGLVTNEFAMQIKNEITEKSDCQETINKLMHMPNY